jgi:hypothetical protein
MAKYKAFYSLLIKSPKYAIYCCHFDNLPFAVDIKKEKESDDVMLFYMSSDDINLLNDAMVWLEESVGLETYKVDWIQDK